MKSFNPERLPAGFRLVSSTPVEGMGAEARRFEHDVSGARIVHVACDDTENCFCICLPTPPANDKGIPHILEHMTLAGSRKYPLKEPFFEMIKRSMATFINALTGSDMTYYPVSSNVHKDLFNLADVYFDAVFHPLLSRDIFMREAHHLAPADPADPKGALRIDGIVYSEMKGVFSDPESILERDACRSLLPDTCHGFESGGDPEAIPDLTLEELRAFHATNYHPSNAFIILYGDIPSEEYLEFLAPRLEEFKRIDPLPPQRLQKPWDEPRTVRDVYPVPADEPMSEKTYLMMSWLLGEASDPELAALYSIISLLLVGNDGAPLKKAVNDSHVGANVMFEGVDTLGLESVFQIAVDGSEPDRLDAFRGIVMDALREAASRPFEPDAIKAAFQQAVYPCVEIVSGYPLNVAFRVAAAWNAGRDPEEYLDVSRHYDSVRAKLEADPELPCKIIRKKLIDNPHRLDTVLAPDVECAGKAAAALEERLGKVRAGLADAEVCSIAADAERLARINAEPNTPELVAMLPKLSTKDIPPRPREFPVETEEIGGGRAVIATHGIPTNGVVYLTASFDLSGLPEELWRYIPRYTGAVGDFGVDGCGWAETARRRAAVCGSLSASWSGSTTVEGVFVPIVSLAMKTTISSLDEALDVFGDALFRIDPRDRARMDELLIQDRTALRAEFVQDARATARLHAIRRMNVSGRYSNEVLGLPQLALLERLAGDTESAYTEVVDAIIRIRDFMLARQRVDFGISAPDEARGRIRSRIDGWLAEMDGAAGTPAATPDVAAPHGSSVEGLSAPLQVAFSAFAMPAPHFSDAKAMPLRVAASLVSSDYVLPEIRFKGNAYGAGLSYDGNGARLVFSSFRDPKVAETYEVFLNALEYVKGVKWTKEQVDNAIITVAKPEAAPFRPAATLSSAMALRLSRVTEDFRLWQWRNLLATTPESARDAIVEALKAGLPNGNFAVAASREMLDAARGRMPKMTISPIS